MGAGARPARLARADREGRARARRDAEDVRAAARGARRTTLRGLAPARARTSCSPSRASDLVLRVHLMSAGRLRYLEPGAKGPKTPMFRVRFGGGGELVLTEAGKKKRAGVWLVTEEQLEQDLAHLGPDALVARRRVARRDPARRAPAAPSAPSRPARDRGHRTRARERDPAPRTPLAVQGVDGALGRGGRAARRRRSTTTSTRALELREQGKGDSRRVPSSTTGSARPCPQCGTPIARVDFEEHTIYYCPSCQTGAAACSRTAGSRGC